MKYNCNFFHSIQIRNACEIAEKAIEKDMHHPSHITYFSCICSRLWTSKNEGTVQSLQLNVALTV